MNARRATACAPLTTHPTCTPISCLLPCSSQQPALLSPAARPASAFFPPAAYPSSENLPVAELATSPSPVREKRDPPNEALNFIQASSPCRGSTRCKQRRREMKHSRLASTQHTRPNETIAPPTTSHLAPRRPARCRTHLRCPHESGWPIDRWPLKPRDQRRTLIPPSTAVLCSALPPYKAWGGIHQVRCTTCSSQACALTPHTQSLRPTGRWP